MAAVCVGEDGDVSARGAKELHRHTTQLKQCDLYYCLISCEGAERQSSVCSCVSLKSHESMFKPPNFSPEPAPAQTLQAERRSSVCSCDSLKSHESMLKPPNFSPESGLDQTPQPSLGPGSGPDPGLCGLCSRFECSFESDQSDSNICAVQRELMREVLQRSEREIGSEVPLEQIYTELYITEGLRSEVSVQHEETQMEMLSQSSVPDSVILCRDIFKVLSPEQQGAPLRSVLTVGVAGVGKTFSVLKFCSDWARGLENRDLRLVVPLSFREMNVVSGGRYSLMELMGALYPSLRPLSPHALNRCKVLIICDGLDESRLSLDFSCELVSEVTQRSEVSQLLVNLIRGDLLPHALIWITTRPAAANRLPPRCVHRVTEVRGFFTDEQKEKFFKSRFSEPEQLHTVLSHLRSSRSLRTMCQIPVFSNIAAAVLEHVLRTHESGPLPQTLTDLFAHFLLVQTQRKSQSSELSPDHLQLLLKLAALAFRQLTRGNITFYEEDLEQVGLDPSQASLRSGLCTEIFKRESIVFNRSVYCFVHLSVQEFLAAVHVLHCFNTNHTEELNEDEQPKFMKLLKNHPTLECFLRVVLEESLPCPNGRLDLFVRFLHGLTLQSNQKLLRALLGPSQTDPETRLRVIKGLKELKTKASPDRCINIFHCLTELHDRSVHQQIQSFLKSGSSSEKLSAIHCSALAHMLQMSEQVLEELDLKSYNSSAEGRLRLVPAVRNCSKALLRDCKLSKVHLELVASALKTRTSQLRLLDLSENLNVNSDMKALCEGLRSSNCHLHTLRLRRCGLSESACSALASALSSNPVHLRVLDFQDNADLRDSGLETLSRFLRSPDCRLEKLKSVQTIKDLNRINHVSLFRK